MNLPALVLALSVLVVHLLSSFHRMPSTFSYPSVVVTVLEGSQMPSWIPSPADMLPFSRITPSKAPLRKPYCLAIVYCALIFFRGLVSEDNIMVSFVRRFAIWSCLQDYITLAEPNVFSVLATIILIEHAPNDVSRMSAESLDQECLEIFTIFTTKHHNTNAICTRPMYAYEFE